MTQESVYHCGNLNGTGPHKPIGSGIFEGVALLEWVWTCWRKYITVGAGFEVSYAQATAQCLNQLPVACKM